MFSLDVWVSYIDIEEIIKLNFENLKGPKNVHDFTCLKNNIISELNEKYADWHKIYTDGSKSKSGKGAAFYSPTQREHGCYKISANVSIMSIELIAIYEAVLFAADKRIKKLVILSDSQSALQHIARCASGVRGVSIAYKILAKINEFNNSGVCLRLQWIPSHIGIRGNEEADRLAKLAVTEGSNYNIEPFCLENLSKYKELCYNEWKEYFDERSKEKGIWYKIIQSQPLRSPWFINGNVNRSYIVLIHRLRSGHYPSNKFGFLMKKVESPNCEVCNKVEDVQHLLTECSRNERQRQIIIATLKLNRLDMGTFHNILTEPLSDGAKIICELFK
ncbi:hypothetical protein ABMA28_004394 [Loxostege sticticalis]|uniref:ribonuclease H n=1 Tax=Loxostege sticticalis TaxID=481309 RepID=A0ABD0SR08_LOXSC